MIPRRTTFAAITLALASSTAIWGCSNDENHGPSGGAGGEGGDAPNSGGATSPSGGQANGGSAGDTSTDQPRAVYVEMRDGVRIAVDVWLPDGATEGVPAVLEMTRYWRGFDLVTYDPQLDFERTQAEPFLSSGLAYVTIDARGSGASFGSRISPWSQAEITDFGEVVDWVVSQEWSNGRVGATGVSYPGNTAAFLGTLGHSAVKAVIPRFYDFDAYASPVLPGGLLAEGFVRPWSESNNLSDEGDPCALSSEDCSWIRSLIAGPRLVDEDSDGSLLAAAIAEHQDNVDVFEAVSNVVFRDDAFGEGTLGDFALYGYLAEAPEDGTAWQSWASWLDAGTAEGALAAYAESTFSHEVVIGAWNHGGEADADPFHDSNPPPSPSIVEQYLDMLTFFDEHLATDATPTPRRIIRYYTMGEGEWRTTEVWPPEGTQETSWYLDEEGTLATAAVQTPSTDTYQVDYTATTGPENRWLSQMGGDDIDFGDRASEDEKLLTYTSAPLEEDLRITGSPAVTTHLATTATDGSLIAYLEAVAPDGRVVYLTEGQLRFVHRQLGSSPYEVAPPEHSFRAADALDVTPGEVMELAVRLLPTSVLVPAGYRLRVALAGHDEGTFVRLPTRGDPTWTVHCGGETPSRLVLPVGP